MQKSKIIKLCKLFNGDSGAKQVCKTKCISGKAMKNQWETGVENHVDNVDNI